MGPKRIPASRRRRVKLELELTTTSESDTTKPKSKQRKRFAAPPEDFPITSSNPIGTVRTLAAHHARRPISARHVPEQGNSSLLSLAESPTLIITSPCALPQPPPRPVMSPIQSHIVFGYEDNDFTLLDQRPAPSHLDDPPSMSVESGPTRPPPESSNYALWHALLPRLINAYNNSSDISNPSRPPSSIYCYCWSAVSANNGCSDHHLAVDPRSVPIFYPHCPDTAPRDVTVYDTQGRTNISVYSCEPHLVDLFFKHRLFPASPKRPQAALLLHLIRMYQALRKHSGTGAYNYALSLSDIYTDDDPTFELSTMLRRQINQAATWYQAVQYFAADSVLNARRSWRPIRPELHYDSLSLDIRDLADSCPACFHGLATCPPDQLADIPQVIVSIDGNFSHKRKNRSNITSRHPLPPRRFLSQDQVNKADAMLNSAFNQDHTAATRHECTAQVRAANPSAPKGTYGPHDITGVMGLCCRHDHPLIFCDITSPGERHHYAVALLLALLEALSGHATHVAVMYDIGCRFARNPRITTLLPPAIKVTWTIPLFHVYGHTASCQALYNPRRVQGMGWTDGEGMERIWSSLSSLIASGRSMSQVQRRFHLEERIHHLAVSKRKDLLTHIQRKLSRLTLVARSCGKILDGNGASLTRMQHITGVSDDDDLQARIFSTPVSQKNLIDSGYTISLRRAQLLSYMSNQRRSHALSTVRTTASSRTRAAARPSLHIPPGTRQDEQVSVLADLLFRSLSTYHIFAARIQEHKGERSSTAKVLRLSTALQDERSRSLTAFKSLNDYISIIDPNYIAMPQKELFLEETMHWASAVALQGSVDLPWWSQFPIVRIVDAYEQLVRIGEEHDRLRRERRAIVSWVEWRIHSVRQRADVHEHTRAYDLILGSLLALQSRWTAAATAHSESIQTHSGPRATFSARYASPAFPTQHRSPLSSSDGDSGCSFSSSSDPSEHESDDYDHASETEHWISYVRPPASDPDSAVPPNAPVLPGRPDSPGHPHQLGTDELKLQRLSVASTASSNIQSSPRNRPLEPQDLHRPISDLVVTPVSMGADGNCGFRAAAHQLHGSQNRWLDVRTSLHDLLHRERHAYSHYWSPTDIDALKKRLLPILAGRRQPEDKHFSHPSCSILLADLAMVPVLFIQPDKPHRNCVVPPSLHPCSPVATASPFCAIVLVMSTTEDHFDTAHHLVGKFPPVLRLWSDRQRKPSHAHMTSWLPYLDRLSAVSAGPGLLTTKSLDDQNPARTEENRIHLPGSKSPPFSARSNRSPPLS
ncbi:hypothetical protein OC861_006058 [Tilletia horrida]|nr:hypothetical protein OC861_006058 [Tilletia horrida]